MYWDPKESALATAVGQAVQQHGLRLLTAESCTGGLLSALLTAVPGASDWFSQAWVTYDNAAKQQALQVPADTLALHGAVSEATAAAMAQGALQQRQRGNAQTAAYCALSITGIAGPDGGTVNKPVGWVCFGWATTLGLGPVTVSAKFEGDRHAIQRQAVHYALNMALNKFANLSVQV